MPLGFQIFTSPLGEILVAGSDFAVTHVRRGSDREHLAADFRILHPDAELREKSGLLRDACRAISEYLNGNAMRIDVAIQADGTEFQRKVWQELRHIPYGTTASYSEVAEAIGTPGAYRAVANACGENPIPLVVPCHRVIHKSGDMSGFGWGSNAKRFLLELEWQNAMASEDYVA